MNADDGSRMEHTKTFGYDPRDRVREVTKTGSGGSVLETESYTHDANNNVISQTVDGATTSFAYERNRLLTASTGGSTASYSYDPFGRLTTVTSGGQTIESYTYDGFSRVTQHAQINDSGGLDTTKYAYDPLDRTLSETTGAGTSSAETTEFDYLGLTGQVLTESVSGQVQRSYTYSPWGQRLSQVKHNATGRPSRRSTATHRVSTSACSRARTGTRRRRMATTAYGKPDTESFTGVDKPDPQNPGAEPYNVYRYNAKRWNPAPAGSGDGSGSYDMGFRRYDPGLNRFLARDLYTGALADRTSPPTPGHRTATPSAPATVTNIELDGHATCAGDGTGRCVASNGDRVGDYSVDQNWEGLNANDDR